MTCIKGKIIYKSPHAVNTIKVYDIDRSRGLYKIALFMMCPHMNDEYEGWKSCKDKVTVNGMVLHHIRELKAVPPAMYYPEEFAAMDVGGVTLYVVETQRGGKYLTDCKWS